MANYTQTAATTQIKVGAGKLFGIFHCAIRADPVDFGHLFFLVVGSSVL